MPDNAQRLSTPEVAQKLGLTVHQVYRRMHRGDIAYTVGPRGGHQYLVHPDELQRYIDAGQQLTAPKNSDPNYLTVGETARRLGFAPETIRRFCLEGKLVYLRGRGHNGQYRVTRESVAAFEAEYNLIAQQ